MSSQCDRCASRGHSGPDAEVTPRSETPQATSSHRVRSGSSGTLLLLHTKYWMPATWCRYHPLLHSGARTRSRVATIATIFPASPDGISDNGRTPCPTGRGLNSGHKSTLRTCRTTKAGCACVAQPGRERQLHPDGVRSQRCLHPDCRLRGAEFTKSCRHGSRAVACRRDLSLAHRVRDRACVL